MWRVAPARASPLQESWDDSACAEPPTVALPARHGVLSVAGVRGQRVGDVVVAGEAEARRGPRRRHAFHLDRV
eukprot:3203131-Pleurochrysis_carterae.AAC.2